MPTIACPYRQLVKDTLGFDPVLDYTINRQTGARTDRPADGVVFERLRPDGTAAIWQRSRERLYVGSKAFPEGLLVGYTTVLGGENKRTPLRSFCDISVAGMKRLEAMADDQRFLSMKERRELGKSVALSRKAAEAEARSAAAKTEDALDARIEQKVAKGVAKARKEIRAETQGKAPAKKATKRGRRKKAPPPPPPAADEGMFDPPAPKSKGKTAMGREL